MKYPVLTFGAVLLLTTLPALAQTANSTSNAKPQAPDSSAPSNSSPEKKKSKKVWTNDEIAKTSGGVSVVGGAISPSTGTAKKQDSADDKSDPRQRQINDYKDQLSKLQSQIDAVDARIHQLKNFKGENTSPSGGIDMNQGYDMVPVADQIKQLEDKRKQLRAKMDDIETDAHKNGITSDDLRLTSP